jgi:hypothetical protein
MNLDEYWGIDPQSEYIHTSELEDIGQAKEFLSDAIDGLYGDAPLDQIERSLEEACAYLKIPFPDKQLTITKKHPDKAQGRALSRTKG